MRIISCFLILSLSSCATMIHGPQQKVTVATEPVGATVSVDGKEAGVTPIVLTLPRKQDHIVQISKEGYHGQTTRLKRTVSGLVVFYLLPGGLLSLGVDAAQGSLFNLPEAVRVNLKPLFDAETIVTMHFTAFKAMNAKLFHAKLFHAKPFTEPV